MIYMVSIGASILMCAVMTVYLVKSGYFSLDKNADFVPLKDENIALPDDTQDNVKDENAEQLIKSDEQQSASESYYSRTQAIVLSVAFVILSFALNYILYTYLVTTADKPTPFLFAKMVEVGGLVYCAALTDYKRRKIPNTIVLFGLVFRLLVYIIEFVLARDSFVSTLKNDGLGFLIGFVMLFVIAVITRGGISYGDVKLFGVMGITAGCAATFLTLFVSLLLSSIVALVLIAMRKKTFKSTLPMAPFICAGYYIICILGIF